MFAAAYTAPRGCLFGFESVLLLRCLRPTRGRGAHLPLAAMAVSLRLVALLGAVGAATADHERALQPSLQQSSSSTLPVRGLIVVSADYIDLLHNQQAHLARHLPELRYTVHAVDRKALKACRKHVAHHSSCTYTPMPPADDAEANTATEGDHYANPFYAFRLGILHDEIRQEAASESAGSILFIDASALVANSTCLRQMLACSSDVVSTIEAPGSPFAQPVQDAYGLGANTGLVLYGPHSLSFIKAWSHYMSGGNSGDPFRTKNDQAAFDFMLLQKSFEWNKWPFERRPPIDASAALGLAVECPPARHGHMHMHKHKELQTLTFLDWTDWPRGGARSEGHCLYHPFVKEHSPESFRARFLEDGFWYLK